MNERDKEGILCANWECEGDCKRSVKEINLNQKR